MSINDNDYLVISCRETNDCDSECDLVIEDKYVLVEAIERTNLYGLDVAEVKLKSKYPQNKIIITHTPLLNLIQLAIRRQDVEAKLIANGDMAYVKPSDSRISKAFNWEERHNPVVQKGSC